MKKIIVIGSPGSGKSVFSKTLSERTELPLYHLDMIWHKPDKTTVSREEFDQRLSRIMQGDAWIIDGNYMRTMEMRLEKCDSVFLLDFPVDVCLRGVQERIGKKRSDMPWVETEPDTEFESFIRNFPSNELPKIYQLLENDSTKVDVTVFKSREEIADYLAKADKIKTAAGG